MMDGKHVYRVIDSEKHKGDALEKILNDLSEQEFYMNQELSTSKRIIMTK